MNSAPLTPWIYRITATLWGVGLTFAYVQSELIVYLHPRFRLFVLLAGIVLVLSGLLSIWLARGSQQPESCCADHDHHHDHHHDHFYHHSPSESLPWPAIFYALLFFAPWPFLFWNPPQTFSENIVLNRGIEENLPLYIEGDWEGISLNELFEQSESGAYQVEILDVLEAARDPGLWNLLANQSLEIIGQLSTLDHDLPTGQFFIVRFFMTCCAADAQPLGLRISGATDASWPSKQWLRIRGTLLPREGDTPPVFHAETIEAIESPTEIFLY